MRPGTTGERSDDGGAAIQSAGYVVVVCLCVIAGLAFALKAGGGAADRPSFPIEDRINPSDASPASLVRLPGIGPARARAIASHRGRQDAVTPAFHRPEDLQAISGIGPATVEAVRPLLSFDE